MGSPHYYDHFCDAMGFGGASSIAADEAARMGAALHGLPVAGEHVQDVHSLVDGSPRALLLSLRSLSGAGLAPERSIHPQEKLEWEGDRVNPPLLLARLSRPAVLRRHHSQLRIPARVQSGE